MTINGYTSRNIPSPKTFSNVLDTRMQAKAAGDKKKANALKLVVNTTYGCLLNQYNPLYDPLMGRSVCISGQLYLLELAEHCYQSIPDLKVVQLNTDGMMIEFDDSYYPKVQEIVNEWQERTGFELEEDVITKIAQKDVNNYVEVQDDGKAKAKGGYLVRGIAPAGAFNINNNACIVATALKEYFVNDIPVEKTINECNEIFQFQLIAKAGIKYKEVYHEIDGEPVKVQKVNRVYATKDTRYGKLYKVKAENGQVAKIESLPEHCLVDNDNHLDISDVDKQFYIDMANKRINDFLGVKPEKKTRRKKSMATATKAQNVYQKLIKARSEFLKGGVEKSGKNMHLEFKYFELDDIVPTATRIFEEIGLIGIVNFSDTIANMNIINADAPDEIICFQAPFNQIEPIVSNTGKQATNSMQALGSSITYMRRYLYMMALDICEPDEIDANIGKEEEVKGAAKVETAKPKATKAKAKAPATPKERKEVKEELTGVDEQATALQIKGLKKVLKAYKEAHPDAEDVIAKIALQTNGFKVINKGDCEALIKKFTEKLEEK